MKRLNFIIYGNPKGKERPRLSRWGTYTPKQTVEYEKLVRKSFIDQYPDFVPLDLPATIHIKAYFGIPKSYNKKRYNDCLNGDELPTKKPDYDNIAKIVSDALNGIAYKDDALIICAKIEKFYGLQPRVEVEIIT